MRNRMIRSAVFAFLFGLLFTVTAFAEDAEVTGSDVNLREGPGTEYAVMDCLPRGEIVTVSDRSNASWYCVNHEGTVGFMSSAYLRILEEESDVLVYIGTETESEPAAAPVPETRADGVINAMYVRFRSGPSVEYSILGEYNKGTALTVIGHENGWTAVILNGQSGYVCSDYVTENASAPVEQPTEEVPVQQPDEPEQPAPAPAEAVDGVSGIITGDYVCFRSGPGTGYSIYNTYNRGTALLVTGLEGDWCKVVLNGQAGYVYSAYISVDDPTLAAQPEATPAPQQEQSTVTSTDEKDGYITGNNVRFRAGASTSSDILGEYNYGNALTITGVSGDWTAVRINGQNGFVYSQYVKEGSVAAPRVEATEGSTLLGVQVAEYALQFQGYPYVWGGSSPDGFDCSGFVKYVYAHFGIELNRVACDQANNGVAVELSDLQPGDVLCFYSSADYIGHVGIYIGNSRFIHASTSTTGVIISELSGYYDTRGYIARRMV